MMNTCAQGGCWTWGILFFAIWLVVGSLLLWLTWNHVIAAFTKVKQAKFWQALLLIGTVCVLVWGPCMMKRGACSGKWGGGKCGMSRNCGDCGDCGGKGGGKPCQGPDCPYENKDQERTQ